MWVVIIVLGLVESFSSSSNLVASLGLSSWYVNFLHNLCITVEIFVFDLHFLKIVLQELRQGIA